MSRLDQLQQKPWYFQFGLFAVVAVALYAGLYYGVTKSIREEAKTVQAQADVLSRQNEQARIASQRLSEFKASYARVQADYDDLKALLPEQRELTSVLQGVQDRARGHLSVQRFSPKEDFQQDFYSGKPIEIEVNSSYNSLGAFFAQMAAYQRIVSISDFKVLQTDKQYANKTVNSQFTLTAYYVSADKLQNLAKAVPTPLPAKAVAAAVPPVN